MLMWRDIPALAPIIETIAATIMVFVAIRAIQKYVQRKKETLAYLTLSLSFYALAVVSSATGKWLQSFVPGVDPEAMSYSDPFILLAYCLSALGNIFLFAFLDDVFLARKKIYLMLFAISNAIVIGLIIPNINTNPESYAASIYAVIFHVLNSLFVGVLLASLSFRQWRKAEERLSKMGFLFIGLFGLLLVMVFVLFAVDVLLISLNLSEGYSVFYYTAWFIEVLASVSGYLGYIMPEWFKALLGVK